MAPNIGGDPLGSILGQMGPIGAKKCVKTVKNYHVPKFEFSTTPPAVIDLGQIGPYGYGTKSRWGPPRVHLGANGVPLGPKHGSKPQKITMPRNSNFHRFWPKMDLTVMAPNHGGDPLGSIFWPMGSHWAQKMGQNRKNYHAQKFEFSQNWNLRLWYQITVGTP